MSAKLTLTVEPRTVTGRHVKTLRKSGLIPANIFGKKIKSQAIQVESSKFAKIYSESGETSLIYLSVGDNKTHPVLISGIQRHPITSDILHVDFRQVVLTEKVTAMIPLELTGESPAVKDKNGVLVQAVNEIEVSALPTDFPENFTLDITSLVEIGDSIFFKDLAFDHTKLTIDLNPDDTLVTIKPQEEEVVEEAPVSTEGEATETPEEAGESPKEGTEPEKPKEEAKPEAKAE